MFSTLLLQRSITRVPLYRSLTRATASLLRSRSYALCRPTHSQPGRPNNLATRLYHYIMGIGSVFSLAAFFLVFREVLEACLVVGVVLAYLNRTGQTPLRRWVWFATASAATASITIGAAFVALYYSRRTQLFRGKAEHIFEGVTFIIAAALLIWMILWMLGGRQMQVNQATDDLVEHAQNHPRSPNSVKLGLFSMTFTQIFREGIEAFIFLTGATSSDRPDAWRAIPLPGILGVISAIAVAYAVFRGLVDLNLTKFFAITGFALIFFAGGLISAAMHEFQEAEVFGPWDQQLVRPWWNWKLWDTSACCDDSNNELFAFFRSLFGYQDTPTFVELSAYLTFWVLVITTAIYVQWSALRCAKNTVARVAKIMSSAALCVGLVALIISASRRQWNGVLMGVLIFLSSIPAVAFTFDIFVSRMPTSVAAMRRCVVLTLAVAFGVYTLLSVALHVAQMACDDSRNACSLPKFYHYGVIFNQTWLEQPRSANGWTSLAVLTLSLCIVVLAGITTSVGLVLYALNVQAEDGAYVYRDLGSDIGSVKDEEEQRFEESVESMLHVPRQTSSKRVENPMLV